MSTIHPYSWSEFPTECLIYLSIMGALHLALFAAGCAVFAVLTIWRRGTFLRRVRRFGLFLGLLLVTGSVANGFWSSLVWGRLYYSTDYVFDFSPFWPITQKLIDAPFGDMRGQLLGVSLFQLQLVWMLFALATWTLTIVMFRLMCRRPPPAQSAIANGPSAVGSSVAGVRERAVRFSSALLHGCG